MEYSPGMKTRKAFRSFLCLMQSTQFGIFPLQLLMLNVVF